MFNCYSCFDKNCDLKKISKFLKFSETKITIKIKYCGVCGSDLHIKNGEWGDTFPQILGHEIIGVIEHIPEKVQSNLSIGDVVGIGWQDSSCLKCKYCKGNKNYFCEKATFTSYFSENGGFAEYAQAIPEFIIPIPFCSEEQLSSIAPFMCGGITAFKPLYNNFGRYSSLLIVGFGGIGTMATRFGSVMFDKTHVLSSNLDKKRLAFELGADSFLSYPLDSKKHSFDLALITTSHKINLNNIVNCMNPGGKIIILGVSKDELNFDVSNIVNNEIIIEGTNTGSPLIIKTMLNFIIKNNIRIPVDILPLDQVNTVLKKMQENKLLKRVVLRIHKDPIQFKKVKELRSELKYYSEKDPVKGIVLKSNLKFNSGELFSTYTGIYTKKLTQHSIYDYHRQLNIVDVNDKAKRIPFYLEHSQNPNLKLVFPGNKIYCIKDIKPGDNLSMNYIENEPKLFKQFINYDSPLNLIATGYKEDINYNMKTELGLTYDRKLDIFSYNNLRYNKENKLHFHDLDICNIVEMYDPDVPLFIYSKKSIIRNINRLKYFLGKHFYKYKLHFSIKSNSMPNILCYLQSVGLSYLDACSPAEVLRGMECGYDAASIQYTSSYLSQNDINILNRIKNIKINIDSFTMMENISHKKIGVRINPMAGMSYNCQKNLQCTFSGKKPSKMGVVLEDILKICECACKQGKSIERIHCHAGNSYLSDDIDKEFINILKVIKNVVKICNSNGHKIKEINLGGGYGVPYKETDAPFDWDKWANLVKSILDTNDICISIEPGDYIMKSSSLLVSRVNTIENKLKTKFVGLNVGMNLNALPAYYDIMSLPLPLLKKDGKLIVDIVGNINESIDVWAKQHTITTIEVGDFIALLNSGGYAESCRSVHSLRTLYNKILI